MKPHVYAEFDLKENSLNFQTHQNEEPFLAPIIMSQQGL